MELSRIQAPPSWPPVSDFAWEVRPSPSWPGSINAWPRSNSSLCHCTFRAQGTGAASLLDWQVVPWGCHHSESHFQDLCLTQVHCCLRSGQDRKFKGPVSAHGAGDERGVMTAQRGQSLMPPQSGVTPRLPGASKPLPCRSRRGACSHTHSPNNPGRYTTDWNRPKRTSYSLRDAKSRRKLNTCSAPLRQG